ncbi:tetratricopeptide repeat protein [Luteimonas vadosa]|uniref:OmpR/PhoB-type domain-containing protein n=1 Tax=Luteimonas vadosa TaxID=1165507 RepID=A0ABP9E2J6_9GAMM
MMESTVYRFDDVQVDLAAHQVTRDGEELNLEPKAFAVLAVLLENAGVALERDELLDRVWGHRHVTPNVLNRVIAQLRKVLGDDAEHPRYIQTLHSLGYRFVCDVERIAPQETQPAPVQPPAPAPERRRRAGDAKAGDAGNAGSRKPARRVQGLVLLLLLVSALAAAVLSSRWEPAGAARPEASIAVLPFTSLSDDPQDRYFAQGLAVEMHDALTGVPGLTVAAQLPPDGEVRNQDVKSLGEQLGVATVLDASVRREGDKVRINAQLSDTRTGFVLWTESYNREMSDVFSMQGEIAGRVVKELLGVLPGGPESLSRRLAPTDNIAAYESYLKGLDSLWESGRSDHLSRAVSFFNAALEADPKFARAQASLCRAEIDRFAAARDASAFERAETACDRALGMAPDLLEVSLALGDLQRMRGETAKAIEQYSKALVDPSLAVDAYMGIARAHGANGRHALALDYFERARRLTPRDGNIHYAIGYQHYLNGGYLQAIAAFREAVALRPQDARAWNALGGALLANGQEREAADAFQRSIQISPSVGALSNLGTLQYNAGDYAEAAGLYRRAAKLDPDNAVIWGNLGDALSAQGGNAEAATAAYKRAIEKMEAYVEVKPDAAVALVELAWYHANLGEAGEARAYIARAEALDLERGEVSLWAAQALARLEDWPAASARLARARREGINEDRIRAQPVLQRLAVAGTGSRGQ